MQHHAAVNTTTVDVVSTAAETATHTLNVPAAEMGARGLVVFDLYGDYLYNNNTSDQLRLRFVMGAQLVGDIQGGGALSPIRSPWRAQMHVMNLGATNSQLCNSTVWMVPPGGGQLSLGANVLSGGMAQGNATVDTSAGFYIQMNVIWTAASANNSFRCLASRVQVLEAS